MAVQIRPCRSNQYQEQEMTRAFDIAAANSPDLFEHLIDDVRIDDLTVRKVAVKEIRRAIVLGHYSGVMPDACQEAFGAFNNAGGLIAAVAYGQGGNSATFNAIIAGASHKNSREMMRVWCHPKAPKNTASFVISKTLRLLPLSVDLVVTFADTGQNHLGIIYQALNFKYLGKSQQGIRYVDTAGVEVTSRLANIYRIRNPERFANKTLKQIREELGWTAVTSHPKHRYAIGVGKKKRTINAQLDLIAQPYPKDNQ